MESTRKIVVLLILIFIYQNSFCQNDNSFNKAVAKLNFKKVERIIKNKINKNREGYVYNNEENGWGIKSDYSKNYNALINWLKIQDCVADAYRDQCENKPAIFPGRSSLGVKFKTNSGIQEKCFSIQEGTTGQINILGWRPKTSKSKNVLSYRNIYDCEGFIEIQKQKCNQSFKSK